MGELVEITLPEGEVVRGPFLAGEGTRWWLEKLADRPGISVSNIGVSRGGRPVPMVRIGTGPALCSVTAGAHADEPAGPLAASGLAWAFSGDDPVARALRSACTILIFPQVNPDGAEANSPWFSAIPAIYQYLKYVERELPGDDVEFAYPSADRPALRPENSAIAKALRHTSQGTSFSFHASLHSMGYAQGAWVLIGSNWVEKTAELRRELAGVIGKQGFDLHDIERRGEKGFSRIEPGFCTTPSSRAMKDFFLAQNDPAMAARFGLNSMEFIQSLGGDPLVLVTEIPNFAVGNGWECGVEKIHAQQVKAPAPGTTLYEKARPYFRSAQMGEPDNFSEVWQHQVNQLVSEYDVVPVPFGVQATLMVEIVLRSMTAALAADRGKQLQG